MAGSKSKGKRSGKDSSDASELARLQKKISAVWEHGASDALSLAEELSKSSTRLDQLAGLYTLLKTPLCLQHKKQEKTKPVEWGSKYQALLEKQAQHLGAAAAAKPAAAAVAALGSTPWARSISSCNLRHKHEHGQTSGQLQESGYACLDEEDQNQLCSLHMWHCQALTW